MNEIISTKNVFDDLYVKYRLDIYPIFNIYEIKFNIDKIQDKTISYLSHIIEEEFPNSVLYRNFISYTMSKKTHISSFLKAYIDYSESCMFILNENGLTILHNSENYTKFSGLKDLFYLYLISIDSSIDSDDNKN